MAATDDLLAAVLRLPTVERAKLARELLDSLEETTDQTDVVEAWTSELQRRLDDVRDGSVQLVELDDVKRRMAARRAARRGTP